MEILFIVFIFIVIGFLIFDLGFLNRNPHKVSMKSASWQSLFWVSISIFYAGLIYFFVGHELSAEFLSAYLTEKMLSVDNLFVIMLIFRYFKLDEALYHRVLYWGILGAVIFRGIFITAGVAIVSLFHWVLYIFGAILVYTGVKLFLKKDDDDDDFQENRFYKFIVKFLPISKSKKVGNKFFVYEYQNKKTSGLGWTFEEKGYAWRVTPLFLILLLVETTDIIFAFDSIPAVFAISQNWFIIFTSNIFAIMGLRALFFLVEAILRKFRFLQQGISFVLIFIGAKMLVEFFHVEISSLVSLAVIVVTLFISFVASVLLPEKKGGE